MKTLPPQRLSPSDYASVQRQIQVIFFKTVFDPVLQVVKGFNAQLDEERGRLGSLQNAVNLPTALATALRLGQIQYRDGVFSGRFSHATSSELRHLGAHFDTRAKVFRLKASEVPSGIKHLALAYEVNVKKIFEVMQDKLVAMQRALDATFDTVELDVDDTLEKVREGFERSAQALQVMPKISDSGWETLKEEYTENTKLYIRRFSEESIIKLRETVQDNALAGYRFDRLVKDIQAQYRTTESKAEFLARTETSIFMASFRKERLSEAGIRRYVWRTSDDQRVRDDHAYLNGRTFFYAMPPIADQATGTRANPGGIWNCRCMDQPVLEPLRAGEKVG